MPVCPGWSTVGSYTRWAGPAVVAYPFGQARAGHWTDVLVTVP